MNACLAICLFCPVNLSALVIQQVTMNECEMNMELQKKFSGWISSFLVFAKVQT